MTVKFEGIEHRNYPHIESVVRQVIGLLKLDEVIIYGNRFETRITFIYNGFDINLSIDPIDNDQCITECIVRSVTDLVNTTLRKV